MDKPLRPADVSKPRGGAIQWQAYTASGLLRDSFFDSEPVPPDTGRDAQMFFIM